MTYLPAHQAQLGAGTPVPKRTRGSRDCGPRSASVGVDKLTEGEKVPRMPEMRQRMGTPGPQTTNVLDIKRGVESYKRPKGREPLRFLLRNSTAGLMKAARRGRGVQWCIDYGVWNRIMGRTGDPNFTGGHAVDTMGFRVRNGEDWLLLYDSLDDKRRSEIPQGPRWVRARKVIAAAEAFAGGNGRAQGGVFAGGQKRGAA